MDAIIDYRGKTPKKTSFGVPLITAKIVKSGTILPVNEFIAEKDYESWMRRGIPQKGDVVMTTEAPLGEIAQLDGRKVALAQRLITLRGKKNLLDNSFLKYLMQYRSVQNQLRAHASGTTITGIKQSELRKIKLPLPPLPEQKAIAHILGTLDDKIELNRRMNETLEAMARAIFKSWFIDFDPVKRNMARRQGQNQPSPDPLPGGEEVNYRGGYDFAGLVERTRELRKKQTRAENIFWELVRDRRFMGLKFRRQHQFGGYIADFYCHERRLVVEFDGGIHASKMKKDHKRDAWMRARGIKVLRFRNEELFDGVESVLAAMADAIEPPPSPSGRRDGDEGAVEELDRLFPDSFEDSELGKIPKGWEVGVFNDLIEILSGGTPKTSVPEYWNGKICWFSVKDAPSEGNVFVIDTEKKITDAGVANSATEVLPEGTTIVTARGTVGKLALVGIPMAINQSCYGIHGKKGYPDFYIYS
ncbi:MAG: DUF559 domain-containing protein [Nitrospinales bacterium]